MVKFEIPLGTAQLLVDFLHKRRIARQPCDKSHIKMCLDPVHKLMAAEMTVPAEFYYCVRPFLMDVFMTLRSIPKMFSDLLRRPGLSRGSISLPFIPSKITIGM